MAMTTGAGSRKVIFCTSKTFGHLRPDEIGRAGEAQAVHQAVVNYDQESCGNYQQDDTLQLHWIMLGLENLKQGKEEELSSHFNNMVSSIFDYAMTNPTQQEETTKGTLFGAYNSATGYFQNVRNFRDEESKLKSIMYGTGYNRSQTAFNLCVDFAKNGSSALVLN